MTLEVNVDLSKIDLAVSELINDVKENIKLTDESEYKIKLVCKELLTNIISYSDATLIKIISALNDESLKIVFEDNGSGFDYTQIIGRDVTDDNYIMADGGRGIYLVRLMSENFIYSEDGRSIEVTLNLV